VIDPSTPPHIVTAIAALAGAFVGLLGNGFVQFLVQRQKNAADRDLANQKFLYERQQAVFKRRFELAEQVLADAYRFKDMMAYVRAGGINDGEGKTRKASEFETERERRLLTDYFVPIERLQSYSEFVGAMLARRATARAHFGEESEKAFKFFDSAIAKVRSASSALIMTVDYDFDRQENKDFREKCLADIWQLYPDETKIDSVGDEIEKGISIVEKFCRPTLDWVDLR
jgi:hypothetical protein